MPAPSHLMPSKGLLEWPVAAPGLTIPAHGRDVGASGVAHDIVLRDTLHGRSHNPHYRRQQRCSDFPVHNILSPPRAAHYSLTVIHNKGGNNVNRHFEDSGVVPRMCYQRQCEGLHLPHAWHCEDGCLDWHSDHLGAKRVRLMQNKIGHHRTYSTSHKSGKECVATSRAFRNSRWDTYPATTYGLDSIRWVIQEGGQQIVCCPLHCGEGCEVFTRGVLRELTGTQSQLCGTLCLVLELVSRRA